MSASLALLLAAGASAARAQDAPPDPDPAPAAAEAAPEPADTTAPADDTPAAEEPPPPPPTGRAIAVWALTGVAGVGVIAGGVFGLTALAEEQRFAENGSQQAKDRGEARALAADISFGVAGAAAVTALILWLTTDDEGPPPGDADEAVTMEVGAAGAGATLGFSF